MRELDDWLLTYLDHAYIQSSAQQKMTFQRLLEYQDQEIFEWMIATAQPLDSDLIDLTERIRASSIQVANQT
jgi:antitoxin CptB